MDSGVLMGKLTIAIPNAHWMVTFFPKESSHDKTNSFYFAFLWFRYIVSDCDSVGVFYSSQHYTSTPEEAAADAIKAG